MPISRATGATISLFERDIFSQCLIPGIMGSNPVPRADEIATREYITEIGIPNQ